jgi:hypothetical protein
MEVSRVWRHNPVGECMPEVGAPMNEHDRRCRRWLQISLRSLFLLTLLVAAYFAGYNTATRQGERALKAEREARELLGRTLTQGTRERIRLENRLLAIELDGRSPNWRELLDPPNR